MAKLNSSLDVIPGGNPGDKYPEFLHVYCTSHCVHAEHFAKYVILFFFLDYLRIVFVTSLSDDQLYHVTVRYCVM